MMNPEVRAGVESGAFHTERSRGYRDSPRQELSHEPFAALQRMRSQQAAAW